MVVASLIKQIDAKAINIKSISNLFIFKSMKINRLLPLIALNCIKVFK